MIPTGLPGYRTGVEFAQRLIRKGDQDVAWRPGGEIIDGTYSGDAGNTSFVNVLRPGKVMVQKVSGYLFRNYIIGKTTAAYVDNDTTLTVPAGVATECARLIAASGASLSLLLVGPPSAAGTVAETAITVTAASGTTLTIADLNLAKVSDSLIVLASSLYVAGSFCFVDDNDYIKLDDELGNRTNQPFRRPLIGGIVDPAQIIDWPADTSTQAWLLAKLNTAGGSSYFKYVA